jgi:predicted RNA binding protein YcfA (HicA-like mRNA interferase family)
MRLDDEKSGGRTVPVPNHREIAVGTLKSIIAQSGLAADLFRK